ncbi:E3 ubiquitin-protein ligase tom1 [Tilletia horrida]|nr:E3 ubiquitin-protein ligase tom1 [Tilletia horrida]
MPPPGSSSNPNGAPGGSSGAPGGSGSGSAGSSSSSNTNSNIASSSSAAGASSSASGSGLGASSSAAGAPSGSGSGGSSSASGQQQQQHQQRQQHVHRNAIPALFGAMPTGGAGGGGAALFSFGLGGAGAGALTSAVAGGGGRSGGRAASSYENLLMSGGAIPIAMPAGADGDDPEAFMNSSAGAGALASLLQGLFEGRMPSGGFARGVGGVAGGSAGGRHGLHESGTSTTGKSKEAEAAAKKEKEANEEKLKKMYEEFDFRPLWTRLSQALTRLKDNPSAAQVLLPLIESLMVVSKHVIAPETAAAVESRTLTRSSSLPPVTPLSEGNDPMTSSIASIASIASTAHGRTPREQMEDHFFAFTERHRKILNTMVRQNPSLMSGSFALLVHNPKVLDFDNKKNYFTQQLHKNRRDHYTPLNLNVRRAEVFGDSQMAFSRYTGPEIKHGRLNVRFLGEEGIDAGGVTREWFSVLARAMFNPDYALFTPCAADRTTYQPNRLSSVDRNHLLYFKFVGRVIGKAIYDGRLLDAYFTRSFYKHILGKPVDYRDMEAVDPEYYKSLEWILENDIEDVLDLNFTMDAEDFGETRVIELKPDGATIPVTEENKVEYVRLVTEQRLTQSIRSQIDAFLEGFHDIIPPELVRIFTEQELELLISGLPDIDVDSWKNNTELHGYNASDPVIQWFWRAVRSFDQTEKAKLLQFITGTSKVPLEGFGHLQGTQGIQKFNIHKAYGADRLPAAHTCFNQLDLPQYESYEKLRSQLLICMNEASEGFGFA